MRIRLVALAMLVAVVVLIVGTGTARVAWAGGEGPKTDVVAGEAQVSSLGSQVRIHAQSGANGENARGDFTLIQGTLTIEGTISCLNVVGNAALAGGTIVSSSNPTLVGLGFTQLTIDNGSPGTDDQSATFLLASPPAVCAAPSGSGFTATSGNYTVHDAG